MPADDLLVVRTPCGLSGDMLLAGLTRLNGLDADALDERVQRIGLPALHGSVTVVPRLVAGLAGWATQVELPHEHSHRGLAEIARCIAQSQLRDSARTVALAAFERLAQVEGEMHGIAPEHVQFHEVGALDSILDVCLVAELHAELGSPKVVCSPLPVSDGTVRCQHGLLATPAPAVLRMLEGVPVYGISAAGETVTPTALALLHALRTEFGDWPAMTVRRTARAYGTRVFSSVPNGALFACGSATIGARTAADKGPAEADAAHGRGHGHGHGHGQD